MVEKQDGRRTIKYQWAKKLFMQLTYAYAERGGNVGVMMLKEGGILKVIKGRRKVEIQL